MAAELQGGCSHRAPARNWVQEIRESGEFSDVVIRIEGQDFRLHKLPLVCASSYFRSLLLPRAPPAHISSPFFCTSRRSSSSSSSGYGVVEAPAPASASFSAAGHPPSVVFIDLQEEQHGISATGSADAFSVVADFCYLRKPRLTARNVTRVLAMAELLDMADLVDATKKFLYTNAFRHWKSAVAFLRQYYSPVGVPSVDEYVKSRCIRAIADKCSRAFSETRLLSVAAVAGDQRSSAPPPPSQVLSYVLAKIASLPDSLAATAVEAIVSGGANLHLSCRQSRNVKDWLKSAMTSDCRNGRERAWVIVCLTRMLQAEAAEQQKKQEEEDRPWLALSSHYWCALLQEACAVAKELASCAAGGEDMAAVEQKLEAAMEFLQERIGGSLHELDEILVSYKLEAPVMVSLVRYFRERASGGGGGADLSVAEVAKEVDECLWTLVNDEEFSAQDLSFLIRAFPDQSRASHDHLYAAVEKLAAHRSSGGAAAELWGLLDIRKLSDPFLEKAMRNPEMLRRTESLAYVLERQVAALEMEMAAGGGGGGGAQAGGDKLSSIMQRVVLANLRLLEENSRRAMEIMELQKLCSRLLFRKQQAGHESDRHSQAAAAL